MDQDMAEHYLNERERQERKSRVTGIALTTFMHVMVLILCFQTGLTFLDPPPPEQEQILIEFEEPEIQKPKQTLDGTKPQAENADPSRDISLVQKSEAQHEGTKSNEAPEAAVDDFGDVDVKEPKKEINRKALFSAADNKTQKDTLAAQTARETSDAHKAGHALGNTKTGETAGEPNAKLAGRKIVGTLPKPGYGVAKAGTVVVKILVDKNGTVTNAIAGAEGTTVTDKTLWQEARKAALEAQFNVSEDAPTRQEGTITYIFKLN